MKWWVQLATALDLGRHQIGTSEFSARSCSKAQLALGQMCGMHMRSSLPRLGARQSRSCPAFGPERASVRVLCVYMNVGQNPTELRNQKPQKVPPKKQHHKRQYHPKKSIFLTNQKQLHKQWELRAKENKAESFTT